MIGGRITKIVILVFFIVQSANAQLFNEMKADNEDDDEIAAIQKAIGNYDYAFCSVGRGIGFGVPQADLLDRYYIIAFSQSDSSSAARKIVLEHILKHSDSSSDSSTQFRVLIDENYSQKEASFFFHSLDSFKFHLLDNDCLMNATFPIPDSPGYVTRLNIWDSRAEETILFKKSKFRKIYCLAPEWIFKKYPEHNLCRAIYIICRNIFYDRIWK